MTDIAVLGAILALVSLFRDRIAGWPLSTPMVFVAAGLILGPDVSGVLTVELEDESVVLAAEITLAMLLFSDAARINTSALRRSFNLPLRLLGIGLPLSVAVGAAVTGVLLVDLSWAEAALVAAILAPTDAALGQAVVSNLAVPVKIRQALNVESGFNDGLIVPVVAVFVALAVGEEIDPTTSLIGEAITEVVIGVTFGTLTGLVMGWAIPRVVAHSWTDGEGVRLIALGGALSSFAVAGVAGGNGFITAFVCGLVLHSVMGESSGDRTSLAEDIGQIGASATFVIFGALMVWPALAAVTLPVVLCAVATLTIGRILPVRIATLGAGVKVPTVFFLGWFGPRGLASMLFGLLIVVERGAEADQLFHIITIVVLASVLLHGMSAAPGARLYARWFAEHGRPEMVESESVPELRVRWTRKEVSSS